MLWSWLVQKLHDNDSCYSWFLREGVFLELVYEHVVNSTSWFKSYVPFVLLFAKRSQCSPYRFGSNNSPNFFLSRVSICLKINQKLFLVGSRLLPVLIYDSETMPRITVFPCLVTHFTVNHLMIRQVVFLSFFLSEYLQFYKIKKSFVFLVEDL